MTTAWGCMPGPQVTYALAGGFETFAATIGIDDVVRPHGKVRFIVRGDGKSIFDSDRSRAPIRPEPSPCPSKACRPSRCSSNQRTMRTSATGPTGPTPG
jgi:hypothetical protein